MTGAGQSRESEGAFTRQRYWWKRNNFFRFGLLSTRRRVETVVVSGRNEKRWPKWKSGKRRSFIRVNLSCKCSKTKILGNLPPFNAAATKFLPVWKPEARVNHGRRQNRSLEPSPKRYHRSRVNHCKRKAPPLDDQWDWRIGKHKEFLL